jgi:hypothetical protein
MSEPVNTPPADSAAFGTSFETALAAAFGEKLEPTSPQPDIPVEPAKQEPVEPVKPDPEPVKSIDDAVVEDEPEVKLPIDEDPPVKDEPKDEEPDLTGMSAKAGERFKQLRTEAKELKSKLAAEAQAKAQLESRLKELEGKTGMTEEVEKKLAEYELELAVSRLEATDAFKAEVTKPLADIATTAEAIADKYSIDMSKLLDAIALSDTEKQDEAFEELLVDVSERDRSKIYALAEKLPTIMERRNELYSKREEALAELEAKKTAAEQATALERAKERKAAVELVVKRVSDKLPFLKSESFSLDPVKATVAETDFDAADTTVKAYNAVAGQLVPQLARAYDTALKEIETLTDELEKYRKTTPAFKGTAAPAPAGSEPTDFVSAIERAFAGVQ